MSRPYQINDMTKILVPFVYFVYENAMKVEKIGYYEDELSNVYNMCKQCLNVHDRHSRFCELCSQEHKAGDHESFKARLSRNSKAIEASQKKIVEKLKKEAKSVEEMDRAKATELTNFGKVMAVINQNERKSKGKGGTGADKVRGKGKDVVQNDIQASPVKRKSKARTKAGVV